MVRKQNSKAEPAVVIRVLGSVQLRVLLPYPKSLLNLLDLLLLLYVAFPVLLCLCARLVQDLVDDLDVFLQELDRLRKQLVAFLQIVGLLVAARNIVGNDTDVDGLDENALLLVLDGQDLQCLLQGAKRLLQVTAVLLVVLGVPPSAIRLVHG